MVVFGLGWRVVEQGCGSWGWSMCAAHCQSPVAAHGFWGKAGGENVHPPGAGSDKGKGADGSRHLHVRLIDRRRKGERNGCSSRLLSIG